MTEANLATVQTIYSAFGRGDVQTILDLLTDDVDWSAESEAAIAPWHGLKQGKAQVPSFFQRIGETLDVTEFTPLAFAASDNNVMAVIRFGYKTRTTGKSGAMNIHHWWQFRDGKVALYRGSEDTALTASTLAA